MLDSARIFRPPPAVEATPVYEFAKLAQLHHAGVIGADELSARKSQLFNGR